MREDEQSSALVDSVAFGAIAFPAVLESREPPAALRPANPRRIRPLGPATVSRAKAEIFADIIRPTENQRAQRIEVRRPARPDIRERLPFAKAPPICLRRRVIVRVHYNR